MANGEWAPFQSQNLKHSGFVSHIISESFFQVGLEAEFQYLPWKRGMEAVREGDLEGTFVWAYKPDRAENFHLSEPVIELKTAIFFRTGKEVEWNKIDDLSHLRFGGVIGFSYGIEELEEQGILKFKRISSNENNFRKLASGRLDIAIADSQVGLSIIENLGLQDEITMSKRFVRNEKYYAVFSKLNPGDRRYVEAFNRGLRKLKESGRYDEILADQRQGKYALDEQ